MSTTTGNEAATSPQTRPDAVCGAVERVRAGLVSGRGWQGIDVASLPRRDLLSTHRDLARMRREIDAMLAYSSAEIARRSTPDDGQDGLAKREGFGTPEQLVASISGGTTGDAHKLIEVGDAMARGEKEPQVGTATAGAGTDESPDRAAFRPAPRFAAVRDGVRAGKLSIDAANMITRMLTRIWDRHEVLRLGLEDVARVERLLVQRAHGLSANRFGRIVRQLEAQMDSGRHALTEELQRQERSVTMYEDQSGMFVLRAVLDAENAAPVRAAIDALVGNALHNRRDRGGMGSSASGASGAVDAGAGSVAGGSVVEDDRSVTQIRADALAALARHCLGCDNDDLPLAATTVVVRLTLADLQDGTGIADIDGGAQPVCIETARRMAASGEIIPVVLGNKGEVLDLGRSNRIFTRAQRIALVERDGGCAFCGAPPGYTEAHHIKWWARDRGPTDLENGVLLCSTCHHRIHRDNWDIRVQDNQVWFTPPSAVDRQRVPRLGGRARFQAPKLPAPQLQAA
jgi:hypothetical protein